MSPPNINDVYESTTTSTMEQYTLSEKLLFAKNATPATKYVFCLFGRIIFVFVDKWSQVPYMELCLEPTEYISAI